MHRVELDRLSFFGGRNHAECARVVGETSDDRYGKNQPNGCFGHCASYITITAILCDGESGDPRCSTSAGCQLGTARQQVDGQKHSAGKCTLSNLDRTD